MTTKNPWLGLASYEEPKNDGNDYLFCGRDEETLDVVRLIDNNLFITLYGSSGIGKTSLLRAGVIPILRRKDYFPLYVRLSQEPAEISYAEAIVHKLQKSGLTVESGAVMKHPDGNDRLYLWNYFATTRFLKDGREVYPVIILDQFEEVFREGDKAKAKLLLKQIYMLLNDELEMPDEAGYSADTNYRFVASIREDFLFVLEDSIDELSMDLYKNNRYRLRPMKPEQAMEVALVPGKDCIEESEKDKVTDRIVALAKRDKRGDIDTLLLSLVCAGSFDKKTGEKITLSDLAVWKSNPMEVYYQDAIKGLSANEVRYIQQHLIREDGSRRRVDAEEVKTVLGEATYRQLTQGKNRLFAIGDKGQVELLHDQLGMAVFEERKKFEEKRQKIKKVFQVFVIVFGLFTTISVLLLFNSLSSTKKERNEALKNQSRFIAEKAKTIATDDFRLASLLAVEMLPKDLNHPDRPYTKEAEWALREAVSYHGMILEGNKEYVYSVCYSPNGNYIASGSEDGVVFVWDELGNIVKKIQFASAILSVSFSPDGKNLAASSWNKIEIWNVERDTIITTLRISAGGWINNVVYSPDGKSIFAACNDNTIKKLDSCGAVIGQLFGHTDRVTSIAFSPNGNQIATTSDDYTIRIWDTESGQLIQTLEGHKDKVNDVCYSPDGKQLVSGSDDYHAVVWDAVIGTMIKVIEFDNQVLAVSYSHDGQYIAFASWNQIDILDTDKMEIVNTIDDGDENWVGDVEFNSNGNNLIYGSGTKVRLVGMNDAIGQHQFLNGWIAFNHQDIKSASYNSSGKRILTTSSTHGVKFWDALSGKEIWGLDTQINGTTTASFNLHGNLIVYNDDNKAILCDTMGNPIDTIIHKYRVAYASFLPNESHDHVVTITTQDSTIRWWCIEKKRFIDSIRVEFPLNYVCHSPNGKYSCFFNNDYLDYDSLVKRYGITSDKIVDSSNWYFVDNNVSNKINYSSPPGKIALNPNGDRFLFAYLDRCELKSEHFIGLVTVFSDIFYFDRQEKSYTLNSVSYNPNGNMFLIATKNHLVKIFNNEMEAVGNLHHTTSVQSAVFSPDGNQVMSVQEDGTVMVWDFPPLQELIDQTRERFKDRPLTAEERRMYYLE